jgi:hypothetical protein
LTRARAYSGPSAHDDPGLDFGLRLNRQHDGTGAVGELQAVCTGGCPELSRLPSGPMPRSFYTDPGLFEKERERIFRRARLMLEHFTAMIADAALEDLARYSSRGFDEGFEALLGMRADRRCCRDNRAYRPSGDAAVSIA